MKRLALTTAAVLATLTAAFAAWELRGAVVIFLISLAVSAAAFPVVDSLVARRVPMSLAILLCYSGAVLLVSLLLFLTAGTFLVELGQATDEGLRACSRLKTSWEDGDVLQRVVAERLPSAEPGVDAAQLRGMAVGALGFSLNVAELAARAVIVLVLSVFWTANRKSFERLWVSLLPAGVRPSATRIWTEIRTGVGAKVLQEVPRSLLAVAVLDAGFHAMGLRYSTIPAYAVGVFRLVPLVGQCLALLSVSLTALSSNVMLSALAVVYTIAVLFLVEMVPAPRLVGARRYNPLLVTATVIALADAYDVAGLLLAPAVAATIQIFAEGLIRTLESGPSPRAADLDARMGALERLLGELGDARPPEVESLAQRLTRLVAEAEEAATS